MLAGTGSAISSCETLQIDRCGDFNCGGHGFDVVEKTWGEEGFPDDAFPYIPKTAETLHINVKKTLSPKNTLKL